MAKRIFDPTKIVIDDADWVDRLSVAIVVQAVQDYNKIARSKNKMMPIDGKAETLHSLDKFFNSSWCDALLQRTSYTPDWIKERMIFDV